MMDESTMNYLNISVNSRLVLLRGSITQDFILLVILLVVGSGDCAGFGSEATIPFCKSSSKAARNVKSSFSVISSISKGTELRVLSSIVFTEPSYTELSNEGSSFVFIFEFEMICGVEKCCGFSTDEDVKRVGSECETVAIVALTWFGPGSRRLSTI